MVLTAEVRWPSSNSIQKSGITGNITIIQNSPESQTLFKVRIKGLPPKRLFGFHIHESPVKHWNDLYKSCQQCGGHFNPLGEKHGSVLNSVPHLRHVGDLINNLKSNSLGVVCVDFYDDLAHLIPLNKPDMKYTILGKSIVIHEKTDDLGRGGTSPYMPYIDTIGGIVYPGSTEDNVIFYDNKKKREESLKTGNAGARMACGNIVPTCGDSVLKQYEL
jgi:Cu/Zn superoxide dismutase